MTTPDPNVIHFGSSDSGGHAVLSPSSAKRWLACPGSVAFCEGVESPDSVYSREGTFAHALAARCLTEDVRPEDLIGTSNGEFQCDAVMAAHIRTYIDAVHYTALLEDARVLLIEQRVDLTPDIWGTADALVLSGDRKRLHVFDLKYGAGQPVRPAGNEQLQIYACAALASVMQSWAADIESVTLHIEQPRCEAGGGEWSIAVEDLRAFEVQARHTADVARQPGAPFHAGDHCRWCPRSSDCPALRGRALEIAQAVFPSGHDGPPMPAPAVPRMSAESLANVLHGADVVEAWIEAVRAEALDRARRGSPIPGFKLVETIGNRRWIDEEQAAAALRTLGLDPHAPREVVSPAVAEKKLGKGGKEIVGRLVHRPVTGVKLVPGNDPRQVANPATVFLDTPLE